MKVLLSLIFAVILNQCNGYEEIVPLEPANPQDGIYQEPRIVNGYVAKPREFPHMCSLLNRHSNKYTLCGGSVISNRYVLTAAHCVKGVLSATISCGSVDRSSPYLSVVSSNFTFHENYDPATLNNDVAIWTLPITLNFDSYVQPIRLPTKKQTSEAAFNNMKATVSGFGRYSTAIQTSSQILRYVHVRIIPNSDCARNYGGNVVKSFVVCSLGLEYDAQGTCHGDSGGPLIVNEGNDKTQIGVISFVSSKGCGLNRPIGFARTSSYLQWIKNKTGINIRT